jgi:AcrR family transcriptional regulator
MRAKAMPTLRQRQTEETRTLILDTAMGILADKAPFSHESIAAEAGVGPRTVYRHFPSRADLYAALWERLRTTTNIRFPQALQQILPLIASAFRSFQDHAELVRATMASEAGNDVRAQGAIEGRAAFLTSLAPHIEGLPEAEQRRLVAVCLAIYSAPFWQLLRDRGELSQDEAEEAGVWAMKVVLKAAGIDWPEQVAATEPAVADADGD